MNLRIFLGQTHIQIADVAANLDHVKSIASGLPAGSLLLLPELWSSSYDLEKTAALAKENGPALKELAGTAQKAQIYIGGSLLEDIDGSIYNCFNLIDPAGAIIAKYQKIHLFKQLNEPQWMKPGQKPVIANVTGSSTDAPTGASVDEPVGMAVCFDLRFPELFRYYGANGCKLILLPAEWPIRRIHHWKILLQARAIENQCFVAGVSNVGQSGEYVYGGNSLLIDPKGNILLEGSQTEEQILGAEIDLSLVDETRQKFPALSERKPEIYAAW